MRRGWIWVIVGGLLGLFIVLFVILYLLGGSDQSPLERIRDIAIVLLALATLLVVLLLGALVGVLLWLALLVRNQLSTFIQEYLVPLLTTTGETLNTAKGTVQFLGEVTARPIIRTYGRLAALRALVRTLTRS